MLVITAHILFQRPLLCLNEVKRKDEIRKEELIIEGNDGKIEKKKEKKERKKEIKK